MKTLFKAALVAVLLFFYSCSKESELAPEEYLTAVNAKSIKSVLKTLVKGAALNAANGIDIGPDGNLYIASVQGQEIIVMDRKNGKILDRLKGEADPEKKVQSPDDLVFSPDGSALYWTDILTGFVGRMDMATGTVVKQFVAPGVNPITFSPDGRLFVGLDFLGDGLYELDPDLVAAPRTIIACPGGFCLGFFNAFDFGPDGFLYGPLFALGQVIKMNVETGAYEIVADGFFNPASAKFDPDGLLTVIDQNGEVVKINIATGEKTLFTTLEPGLDNMVFDEDGTLYMTNNDEGWVAEILPSGQARTFSPGGMIVPQGIAVMAGPDNQDMVFEADIFSLRVFNGTNGRQEAQYKGFLVPLPGVISLTLPLNVSASGSDLIISSFFSSTVQVWNPQAGVLNDFADKVEAPLDAVRLNSGEIIVSDIGQGGPGGGIFRMSDDAQLVAFPGAASGLATDGETVWAADWGAGIIFQIDFNGGAPNVTVVADGLTTPEGLAVDHEGRLLVYETRGFDGSAIAKLTRIDLSDGTKTTLAEGLDPSEGGLPGFPPMWFLDGVDVGPSGDIYIRGGESNSIYKIQSNKVH